MDYTALKSYAYLDKVGIMHTGVKSFKHRDHTKPLHVPCTSLSFPSKPTTVMGYKMLNLIFFVMRYICRSGHCSHFGLGVDRAANLHPTTFRRSTLGF